MLKWTQCEYKNTAFVIMLLINKILFWGFNSILQWTQREYKVIDCITKLCINSDGEITPGSPCPDK